MIIIITINEQVGRLCICYGRSMFQVFLKQLKFLGFRVFHEMTKISRNFIESLNWKILNGTGCLCSFKSFRQFMSGTTVCYTKVKNFLKSVWVNVQ